MNYGSTLGFDGVREVKYADFVNGGEVMKMIVLISRESDSRIERPLWYLQRRIADII